MPGNLQGQELWKQKGIQLIKFPARSLGTSEMVSISLVLCFWMSLDCVPPEFFMQIGVRILGLKVKQVAESGAGRPSKSPQIDEFTGWGSPWVLMLCPHSLCQQFRKPLKNHHSWLQQLWVIVVQYQKMGYLLRQAANEKKNATCHFSLEI